MTDVDVIAIVCNQKSHSGRVATIAVFTKQDMTVTGTGEWHQLDRWTSHGPAGPAGSVDESAAFLHGNQLLPNGAADFFEDFSGRARARYALECKLCGLRVETTADRFWPLLSRLAERGVNGLSLAGLAAIL